MFDSNIIKKSHERSKGFGIDKEIISSKKILQDEEINILLDENRELIDNSSMYIDMIYETIEDNGFILILTDNKGCILNIKGDNETINEFSKFNLNIGVYMNEENIGTNAMGIALAENRPVQVTADEHFIQIFNGLTCSAAPIHNTNGDIIGTLNLTGRWDKKHPHTLGLVTFAVKAIENEIYKLKSQEKLHQTYYYMESVMQNVDKGVMIVDLKGKIININEHGAKILENEKNNLINKYIDFILPDWMKLIKSLEDGECTINKEINLYNNSNITTIINIRPIKEINNVIGMVLSLKDEKKQIEKGVGRYTFDDIIGTSKLMKDIITNCKIIANSPSTILIEGESGTGKEVLAQSIHNYSNRNNKKFIAINCGAIPSNLIESELFGYEDGTFTGGKKGGKIGKVEMANGGTLFLDEIGEMPMELQVNLLRVIQEGKITRLGGNEEINIDVRIIAATNKNLKKEIENGRFREDLYYRICVIPIRLPALRERRTDIKELINYFLRIKSAKLSKCIPIIDKNLYVSLINYSWPGNIRQLENAIENIVNLNGEISISLDNEIKESVEIPISKEISESDVVQTLDELEESYIKRMLKNNNNNICKTSQILGVSRNTLYNKIKKYTIQM